MRPRQPASTDTHDLFRHRLENMLDQRHELFRLAGIMDWERFDDTFGSLYCPDNGCPGKATRLMVGLEYLKHMHGLSDEAVVAGWVENPYWQYFCGEEYFQHRPPIDPSSLTRFRRRIGASGCEEILKATIDAGLGTGAVKPRELRRVTVDTTVQDKAVTFPTDGKLLNRSRVRLVKLCRRHGVVLRQSYARKGPQALVQANQYAHARQLRRMRRQVNRLRTYLGRVVRDIERKTAGREDLGEDLGEVFGEELAMARRLLVQGKQDRKKLYSLHAPEVECISKGKAHKRYEFGVKVSIATTNRGGFVLGGVALSGNPYDGHTLKPALDQVRRLTGRVIDEVFVDRGYRGHAEEEASVYISGQRRGVVTRRLRKCLKRRQAIEPVIGHLKSDGHLGRNWLKGEEGDRMNVLLCCAGHNLRLILRRLRFFCLWILGIFTLALTPAWSGRWKTPAYGHGGVPPLALVAA